MDAWASIVILIMSAAVLWRTRSNSHYSVFSFVVLAISTLPLLQLATGNIFISGTAWVAVAYFAGLGLAVAVGQRWETHSPAQLGDALFLAIGIAAMFSVGLQLHQWLQLDLIKIWSMGNAFGRPFANFGQPNQLGTLILWGMLALGWGTLRGYIRLSIFFAGLIYLMFGLALTASRTAWVGVILILFAVWYWRNLWPWRSASWTALMLTVCFFAFVWVVPILSEHLLLSSKEGRLEALARLSAETRPQIWALFIDAVLERPWFGYGVNQVAAAQLTVGANHSPVGILFSHSHNLFLDLFLWFGLPIGLIISSAILIWLWRVFRSVGDAYGALLLLLILVIGNHAMLELPLHYAYFLLPTGLVIGALDNRSSKIQFFLIGKYLYCTIWFVITLLLGFIVRDYMKVEASYQVLRFEWANIRSNASREPPDVLLLNQLQNLIIMARLEPGIGMSEDQLDWMRNVASTYPSAGVIHKLAAALAWNNKFEESQVWLKRLCVVASSLECNAVKAAWSNQSLTDPLIAKVSWPN